MLVRREPACVCMCVCARVFACLALNSGYICLLPPSCIPVDGFIFSPPEAELKSSAWSARELDLEPRNICS